MSRKHKSFTEERFAIIANYKRDQKRERLFNIIVAVVVIITLLVSYSFILQPKYEAPMDEIENVEGAHEFTEDNAHIVKESDGTYTVVFPDGSKAVIEEETASMMEADGFIIIE